MLQMVQQMRQSLLDESEQPEGFGGSTMQETFDSEFSRYLAQSGGVGLGAFMTRDPRRAGRANRRVAGARSRRRSPVSFALPPASPARAAGRGRCAAAPVSRSADSARRSGVGRSAAGRRR